MKNTTETYEKPSLRFVSLRSREAVANTCWGNAGKGVTYFYNTQGTGYVSFQIGGGSCTLSLINVTYYDSDNNPSSLAESDPRYQELYKALKSAGGESGNRFQGEGNIFPNNPNTGWS